MQIKSLKNLDTDEVDRQIVYELEENCKSSLLELSRKMDISKRMMEYRTNRLVSRGVITKFIALLDFSKLGYINYEVWIQLKEVSQEKKQKFLEYLISHPHTHWVASCGGKLDFVISIMSTDAITFSKVLKEIISENPGMILNYFITISTRVIKYPRSYLISERSRKRKGQPYLFSGPPKKEKLDISDLKILSLLSENAKLPAVEIARKTGISANTVRTRIKSLEDRGIIQGYQAVVDPNALGFPRYELLLDTNCLTDEIEKSIEEYCRSNPYIVYMIGSIGKWDVSLAFNARDSNQFQQILIEIRSRFGELIRDYEFTPILNTHKFSFKIDEEILADTIREKGKHPRS